MVDLDFNASFLKNLTHNAHFKRLSEFEHAARWLPVTVVSALDDEYAVLVVDDDAGDAYRVLRRVRHCRLLTSVTVR